MQTLTISVAELLGHPGKYRDFSLSQTLEGLRTALAAVDGTPFAGAFRAESVVEGVLVTGRVRARVAAQCARCLTAIGDDVDVDVCELFAAPGATDLEDDAYQVSGTDIDLEPMVRDALTLALPLNPLCMRECKGLCAGCGADLNHAECSCSADSTDPRWAPLDELRARLENA